MKLINIFNSLDKDLDGKLSKVDLQIGNKKTFLLRKLLAYKEVNFNINLKEDIDKIMNYVDVNKSGEIDYMGKKISI